ncbi:unnamed protein product [Brassica oleracea var. botrytis]|uniref:(rape) hypothetical protein n=1 Tax=Brassica napus TaxID=3708 RepID=A0A816V2W3_BRANA|nr:unnamed protein product [Brassica napus]
MALGISIFVMGFSFSDVVLDHHSPADEALRAQQPWRKFRLLLLSQTFIASLLVKCSVLRYVISCGTRKLETPEDTFTIYTQMATDCTKFQIEINVYALSDKYTDIASLGFINLDCGLQANESPYTEPTTKLIFTSDADFIKTGKSGRIQNVPGLEYIKPYTVLRYFPDGVRNCYTLSVVQDTNYLIVAMFTYGNYDNLDTPPKFDLYLGPNIWTTVDLQRKVNCTREELIHVARSTSLQSGSLRNLFPVYLTDSKDIIRYPEDVHDRLWSPFFVPEWRLLRRSLSINTSDNEYDIPEDILVTAVTPANV